MAKYFVGQSSCWRRFITTDTYDDNFEWSFVRKNNEDPDTFIQQSIGKFKHEIFAFCLKQTPYEDGDTKAIYLYISGFRYLKCFIDDGAVVIECRSDSVADMYRNASELLVNGRWQKYEKEFYQNFKQKQYAQAGYIHFGYFRYEKKSVKLECRDAMTLASDTLDQLILTSGVV